jgi:hypothetical protein
MEKDDLPVEHLTPFEYYFYLTNGWVGTVLNLIVLFIALRHADTHDKPRQVEFGSFLISRVEPCKKWGIVYS